jgi:hypothetical protein
MVRTNSFIIQANLQHSIAASRVLSRTLAVKGIDLALIQEPWMREGRIMGLNIQGYTLFCAGGTDRSRACIIAKNMNIWMLPGFSTRDLVAVQIKYFEGEAEKMLVACSAYLPYDSEKLPTTREFEELVCYCEQKNLHLIVGCDSNCNHTLWGSTNGNDRGMALSEFLNTTNLEILNRDEPTFCNSRRLEVIDINLGSIGFSESIKDWEVSSEPSLSRLLKGSVPERLFRDPRGTKWDSFRWNLRGRLEQGPKMNMKDEAGLGLNISYLQQALISAYENKCPLRVARAGKLTLRWTSNLETLRREIRRLFNKSRRERTSQN